MMNPVPMAVPWASCEVTCTTDGSTAAITARTSIAGDGEPIGATLAGGWVLADAAPVDPPDDTALARVVTGLRFTDADDDPLSDTFAPITPPTAPASRPAVATAATIIPVRRFGASGPGAGDHDPGSDPVGGPTAATHGAAPPDIGGAPPGRDHGDGGAPAGSGASGGLVGR